MKNRVELIGRVGIDPTCKKTNSGKDVTNFSIATSEYYKQSDGTIKEATQWHNITLWGTTMLKSGELIVKGVMLSVIGKIQYRSWENEKGEKKYFTEIIANQVEISNEN